MGSADRVLDARTLVQPDLFVEVLSPGSARYDRGVKRARNQWNGEAVGVGHQLPAPGAGELTTVVKTANIPAWVATP